MGTPIEAPQGQAKNCAWIRYRLAAYLGGRGITWGGGPDPIVPVKALDAGKFSLTIDWQRHPALQICDTDYSFIAPGTLDHVFVGPRLALVNDPEVLIPMLAGKLKFGGHLNVHVPETYGLEKLRGLLTIAGLWQEKSTYLRDGQCVGTWKLRGIRQHGVELPLAGPHPRRACIARYGAIGDMLMVTPLIRQLAEDGYEVTMNVTPYALPVLTGNPYVSNVVIQERDMVPNQELGEYFAEWSGDYQKYINLSESIEGSLLKVEGRKEFYTPKAARASEVNYYEHTLAVGGYLTPTVPPRGELYFNSAERKAATYVRQRTAGKFLLLWGLRGSSYHKQFPYLRPFLEEWLRGKPEVQVMLCGGPTDRELGFETPQVMNTAGQIPLREVFGLTQVADLVVGPESSLINAAGCFETPKVVLLSHSSEAALCKHFQNYAVVAPESPCYPCNQIHYNLPSCPLVTIQDTLTSAEVWKGPRCCAEYPKERLKALLDQALAQWHTARQPQQ